MGKNMAKADDAMFHAENSAYITAVRARASAVKGCCISFKASIAVE